MALACKFVQKKNAFVINHETISIMEEKFPGIERAIEYETIKDFVNENLYYEVSSKTGNNVSLAFEQLAYNIVMKQAEEEGNPDKVIRGKEGRKTYDLRMSSIKHKKKCC